MPPSPPTYVKGGKQTRHTMAGVFNISEGSEVRDPHFCRIWTVDLKLIRALTCGENSWLSNFWLDTDGRSMHTYCPNQLCALSCKRKQAQDTEYTHFISKEGHIQSNVSENTCKNSLDAIRIFLRTIEDTYQVDKITWNSGNTTEKLWKLSAENFWIN